MTVAFNTSMTICVAICLASIARAQENTVARLTKAKDAREMSLVMQRDRVIADIKVDGGLVRFIDEGDSVGTLIKGPPALFKKLHGANSPAEMFRRVAPRGTAVPGVLAEAALDVQPGQRITTPKAEGPERGGQFEVGDDPWANGCDGESFNQWVGAFDAWVPAFGIGFNNDSQDLSFGADHPDIHANFGTRDQIWFGVCLVAGNPAYVSIEQYDPDYYGEPTPGGRWVDVPSTFVDIGAGQRYLYASNQQYTGKRRATVHPLGDATVTGYRYFISAASIDESSADETLTFSFPEDPFPD